MSNNGNVKTPTKEENSIFKYSGTIQQLSWKVLRRHTKSRGTTSLLIGREFKFHRKSFKIFICAIELNVAGCFGA